MFASKDTLLTRPSGGYNIARSVRMRSSATAYFNRTLTTPTNNKIWTWSSWVKRGTLGSAQVLLSSDVGTSNTTWLEFGFDAADTFTITAYSADSNTTSAVFRDPSAWYHIVVAFDSTQATAANRCKIYVNGVQQTLTGAGFTLNAGYGINSAQATGIGYRNWASGVGRYFDGYLTEINFIDGQALTPSSFGETDSITGVWKPKAYSGTYGTNGFYLNFSDNSSNTATTIGKDYSGNGNNWTPNNISVTAGVTYDSMTDVPTLTSATAANYPVINPVDKTSYSITNANLSINTSSTTWYAARASMAFPTTGKWYVEGTLSGAAPNAMIGIGTSQATLTNYVGSDAYGWSYYQPPNKVTNGTASTYGTIYTTGDTISVLWDAGAGSLSFYKNGVDQGVAFSGLASGEYFLMASLTTASGAAWNINFGQRPFSYTPPTGFVALNTYNLPASTITNGAAYMAATTYTGNGSTQSISNSVNSISFQPDFVWLKSRSNAYSHALFDSVRGATKQLSSDSTGAEATYANSMTAFNSNGFSVGSDAIGNGNTSTFVGWQWKAGTTSASNTNGSITSTVSVGATQGFSVVTYTGTGANATVGHGLGVAPQMVIVKSRSLATGWNVYHQYANASPASGVMTLQTTDAFFANIAWNSTVPTSSVFSIGPTGYGVNNSAATYVAYCFSAVAAYSAFGSYTGNGSADGPFVFTNFSPRWVMVKRTDTADDWFIIDTSRNTYNVATTALYPNSSSSETSNGFYNLDILSNGFKVRATNAVVNASGGTYIYACFASNPLKLSLAR
jgi:hypothetical protein